MLWTRRKKRAAQQQLKNLGNSPGDSDNINGRLEMTAGEVVRDKGPVEMLDSKTVLAEMPGTRTHAELECSKRPAELPG